MFMPLGAISHAELNAEIDAEADEQHKERNRDQIERADHGKAERGRRRKPDHQAEENRGDDFPGAKRQPENDQDAEHRRRRVAQGAVSDDRELIVIHRHLAGQIDGGAEFVFQVQIGCRAVNPLCGLAARLKRRKIERRLDLDKVPQPFGRQRVTLEQLLPGKCGRLSGQNVAQGSIGQCERPCQLLQLDLACLDALGWQARAPSSRRAGSGRPRARRSEAGLASIPRRFFRHRRGSQTAVRCARRNLRYRVARPWETISDSLRASAPVRWWPVRHSRRSAPSQRPKCRFGERPGTIAVDGRARADFGKSTLRRRY